jgi:anthranilate synthase/aminodeoxychorismate synthase-like glutamine amidotransferase
MLLIIDNYDSFTYNLVQYFGELKADLKVIRNDEVSPEAIEQEIRPERVVISPGPGTPDNAGISVAVIKRLSANVPILGVCLGHQAIGRAFGARINRAPEPIHGKPSDITHIGRGLFEGISSPLKVGRYHSLILENEGFPGELEITAETSDGIIMGLKHKTLPLYGVQFHPESILTDDGIKLLQNFLSI